MVLKKYLINAASRNSTYKQGLLQLEAGLLGNTTLAPLAKGITQHLPFAIPSLLSKPLS